MPTKQQIKEWQKKYGEENVRRFACEDDKGKEAEMYFFKPKAHPRPYSLYSRGMSHYRKDNVIELGTLVINECWLDGDPRFRDVDNMLHISAALSLSNEMDFTLGTTSSTSTESSESSQG